MAEKEMKDIPGQRREMVYLIDIIGLGLESIWSFFDMIWSMGQVAENPQLCRLGLIGQRLTENVKMQASGWDDYTSKHCGRVVGEALYTEMDTSVDSALINARFEPAEAPRNVVSIKGGKKQ